ncbi:nucleic acid-binding, OB-fold protein [Artemisia annua]|uniref:Nucleic acid-binding, OB-fold protein n=1 Tax=Artemisia annua TaxID=35608 RepID=A0A2U1QHT0_ARTAN|nr:nucleic acid-binding, OB-fold protein [Artemisia annua]
MILTGNSAHAGSWPEQPDLCRVFTGITGSLPDITGSWPDIAGSNRFWRGASDTRNDSPFHNGPVILNFSQADAPHDDESMPGGVRGPGVRQRSYPGASDTRNDSPFHNGPVILNFSQADAPHDDESMLGGVRGPGVRQRSYPGRPNTSNADALPTQGPLAPPQREGAPSEYVSFGSCNQVCQYCGALFWAKEKKAGTPVSAPPQFGKCCAESAPEVMALATSRRSLAYFTELNPADNSKFIEARVYREWTAMKVPSLIPTGFSCILLDKKGSAIQANADLKEKECFKHDLQINRVYRIQGFGFEKADSWGKTLDNDITLCFGKHTQVDLLSDDNYPHHYFNFAAYNELGARLEKRNPILTDYIGYIHNVEKVKEYGGATGNKIKLRNIGIRNLNNNVVVFTLWNEKADAFEEEEYSKMQKPVVLAVSSCYLKAYGGQLQLSATSATCYYFNPPVDETSELLAAYNENPAAVPQLELQTERLTNWEQERTRNRVPLGTLLQIDPNTQQEVMILRVDTTQDWYYQKCDECGGKLRYGYVHGHCHQYGTQPNPEKRIVMTDGTGNATMTCFSPQTEGLIKDIHTLLLEVANKDPQVIPPQILALENTRHIFQFRFAKPAGKGPPTFVLQKVMDHLPSILPAPSEGPSSPPITTLSTETTASVTPPPTTPSATQDTPANTVDASVLPSSSAVRKELFTEFTEDETHRESKKHKTD